MFLMKLFEIINNISTFSQLSLSRFTFPTFNYFVTPPATPPPISVEARMGEKSFPLGFSVFMRRGFIVAFGAN